jgi:hypothetical protein
LNQNIFLAKAVISKSSEYVYSVYSFRNKNVTLLRIVHQVNIGWCDAIGYIYVSPSDQESPNFIVGNIP